MSTKPRRRIAIIGAGVSGILAIKACKEEEELFSEIVCYERTQHPGGLWMYREDTNVDSNQNITNYHEITNMNKVHKVESNVTTVMKGTIANSSKEMSAFSDFPPEFLAPNFMHHREMLKYILTYAKHFDCLKHIQLESEVLGVTKVGNQMSLVLRVESDGNSRTINELFDIVLIASGHHGRPFVPSFPGQNEFQGNVFFLSSYILQNN